MQLEHLSRKLLVWGSVWKPCVGQLKIQNPARHWSDQRVSTAREVCSLEKHMNKQSWRDSTRSTTWL